jgi:hypothetical protein
MAQTNTNTVAAQFEKVRKKIPLMFNRDNIFFTKLTSRGDVEKVSSRAMRLPLMLKPGGKAGQFDADGGDLGRGSGSKYDFASVSPLHIRFAVEITKLVEWASDSPEKAISNMAKKEIKESMAQFRNFLDKYLQTGGDCVLAEIATGGVAGNDLTLDVPNGANLLYYGQTIQVYSSNLVTNRGSAAITALDYEAGTITLDAAPGGTVDTDKIVVDGVTGAAPVGLFGIPYHQSDASTGSWLNLSRVTYPEIRTPSVNASSSALTTGPIRLCLNKIRKALGVDALSGNSLIAHMNVNQEDAYEQLGIIISEIIKEGSDKQGLDLFFNGQKRMSGVPIEANTNADPTRIDFLSMSHWGRAVMRDLDFYEEDGRTIFPVYGGSGGISAAFLFYYTVSMQVWTDSPRSGAYIKNLLNPTGYTY